MKQGIAKPFDRRVCERLEKLQSKHIAELEKEREAMGAIPRRPMMPCVKQKSEILECLEQWEQCLKRLEQLRCRSCGAEMRLDEDGELSCPFCLGRQGSR